MTDTWPATRLTATETGELDVARTHLRALVHAAVGLLAAAGHDPDRGDCGDAACRLSTVDEGPRLCSLAHRLALVDLGHGTAAAGPADATGSGTGLSAALAAFRLALVDALDAVRACRSVAHAEGRCWFTPAVGADGCGEVLRVAHRVS